MKTPSSWQKEKWARSGNSIHLMPLLMCAHSLLSDSKPTTSQPQQRKQSWPRSLNKERRQRGIASDEDKKKKKAIFLFPVYIIASLPKPSMKKTRRKQRLRIMYRNSSLRQRNLLVWELQPLQTPKLPPPFLHPVEPEQIPNMIYKKNGSLLLLIFSMQSHTCHWHTVRPCTCKKYLPSRPF